MTPPWNDHHELTLLENGEAYFPAVFEAIEQARHEVLIETFIWFDDQVGRALQRHLIAAARRGVRIDVMVDGYGSPDLSDQFVEELTRAGVRLHVFDPCPTLFGVRLGVLRRMHRKIVVVDGRVAFVGGINYSADHLADFGPEAKQDYAMRVEGPVVDEIHRFVRSALAPAGRLPRWRPPWWLTRRLRAEPPSQRRRVLFVTRDNHRHRDDIERHYRQAIQSAREEVIIANAYFFPGYRLLRDLRQAARRGVRVSLILQGQPDMPIVKTAARLLHEPLLKAGVEIHEYCERPLHGKVAVVDRHWATVGSSNLDPLSLSLNLEANLMIRDEAFNATLRERLDRLRTHHCRRVSGSTVRRTWWRSLLTTVSYHLARGYQRWAAWLPRHEPQVTTAAPPACSEPRGLS